MLNELQEKWCSESTWDFSDLKALFLNCTLKRSPEPSHTDGLIQISQAILEKNGVSVESLRPIDYDIATGVYPDMTEHGWEKDDWPQIYEKVEAAHILVITSPIWLGEKIRSPGSNHDKDRSTSMTLLSLSSPTPLSMSVWKASRAASPKGVSWPSLSAIFSP